MAAFGNVNEGDAVKSAHRASLRALSDAALLAAMADGDVTAWAEFDARFRPVLENAARRMEIPTSEWPECIDEVLEDQSMRLTAGQIPLPMNLAGWLVASLDHRRMMLHRSHQRRERAHYIAQEIVQGIGDSSYSRSIIPLAVRDANPAFVPESAFHRLGELVARDLTDSEVILLAWVGEGVPRRLIAEWTDMSYEATKKRIQRLCTKLRTVAAQRILQLARDDQHVVARLFRGASPIASSTMHYGSTTLSSHKDAADG